MECDRKTVELELEKIRLKGGGVLTPDAVVASAKRATSPLHGYFTWDNDAAAEQWRREQARALIRSVQVITTTSTRTFSVPKYVRDPRQSTEQGYAALVELRDETSAACDALAYECTRAAGVLTRARDIAEVLGLTDSIDSLLGGVAVLKRETETKRRKAS